MVDIGLNGDMRDIGVGPQDITRKMTDFKTFQEVLDELNLLPGSGEQEVIVSGDIFKKADLIKAFETFRQYVQDNYRKKQDEDPDLFFNHLDGVYDTTKLLATNTFLKQEALIYAEHEEP